MIETKDESGWTEVVWSVPSEQADELAELFGQLVEGSVLVESSGAAVTLVAAVESARDTPMWRTQIATALEVHTPGSPEFRALDDHDWKNAWRDVWHPFRVRPFAIVPKHFEGRLRPGDVRVVLEPSVAFGTGRHATTRACLRALGELDLAGARVLDAGFGTGLLGVAAALRGAREVRGFDVDRHALPVANDLARDNGVAERCHFEIGGFERLAQHTRPFDLILANIYADVIESHAEELAARLAPGGTLVVSGCAREHRMRVRAALERAGRVVTQEAGHHWRTFTSR